MTTVPRKTQQKRKSRFMMPLESDPMCIHARQCRQVHCAKRQWPLGRQAELLERLEIRGSLLPVTTHEVLWLCAVVNGQPRPGRVDLRLAERRSVEESEDAG